MTQTGHENVIELLVRQHRRIREMFAEVERADGRDRQDRFEELRRFLAVHETAEELVVHPRVSEQDRGRAVVDARLAEERWAKVLLHELDSMDTGDTSFPDKLANLRTAVMAHADSEEREELPLLLEHCDEKTLGRLADAVRAAEALAPTHPHPGVESFTANLLAGPLASLVDRTRDAVRAVLRNQ